MFRITIITLMLCSISLSSCLKENGRWANDDWDSLPESGYYEWIGNTTFDPGTYAPLDSLILTNTPEQAGFTAGYKFIFQPKALARVEFIINGNTVMSKSLQTVEEDYVDFNIYTTTLGDNTSQAICRIRSYSNGKNKIPHNKHFVLLKMDHFNGTGTMNFGEGYPFFMKVD